MNILAIVSRILWGAFCLMCVLIGGGIMALLFFPLGLILLIVGGGIVITCTLIGIVMNL